MEKAVREWNDRNAWHAMLDLLAQFSGGDCPTNLNYLYDSRGRLSGVVFEQRDGGDARRI